jgi:hypothetical protein
VTPCSFADAYYSLKIEAACSSENLGTIYQTTRRQSPEDHNLIISLLFGSFRGKSLFWEEFMARNLLKMFQSVY